jgi:cytochrome c oxidase subunit IV
MSRLGLIVSIFMAMIKDVVQFVVIYAILVLAFSMLFLGVGDPQVQWGYRCMCIFGNVGERT